MAESQIWIVDQSTKSLLAMLISYLHKVSKRRVPQAERPYLVCQVEKSALPPFERRCFRNPSECPFPGAAMQ
jgi:hypothetical protein